MDGWMEGRRRGGMEEWRDTHADSWAVGSEHADFVGVGEGVEVVEFGAEVGGLVVLFGY
jgi:hypothetical protein